MATQRSCCSARRRKWREKFKRLTIKRKTKKSNQKKIKEGDIVVDKSTPMSTTTKQHAIFMQKSYDDKTLYFLRLYNKAIDISEEYWGRRSRMAKARLDIVDRRRWREHAI